MPAHSPLEAVYETVGVTGVWNKYPREMVFPFPVIRLQRNMEQPTEQNPEYRLTFGEALSYLDMYPENAPGDDLEVLLEENSEVLRIQTPGERSFKGTMGGGEIKRQEYTVPEPLLAALGSFTRKHVPEFDVHSITYLSSGTTRTLNAPLPDGEMTFKVGHDTDIADKSAVLAGVFRVVIVEALRTFVPSDVKPLPPEPKRLGRPPRAAKKQG